MKTNNKQMDLYCSCGNVDIILKMVEEAINGKHIRSAKISQQLAKIPQDHEQDAFYPLVLTADDGTVIRVSEVRCGYRGHSTDAMVEALKMSGFELRPHLRETIYNEPNIELTLYNE